MTLVCDKSTIEKTSRAKMQSTHTENAADEDDCCSFQITIYYCSKDERFFIRKNAGKSSLTHHGHIPKQIKHRTMGTRDVPEDQLQTCIDLLEKNCPTNIVNFVLQVIGNKKLSTGSMDYLRRSVLISKHKNHCREESTATTFIRLLKSKNVSFTYFTGSYNAATKLVRFFKRSSKVSFIHVYI